jgi:hypothetical protein
MRRARRAPEGRERNRPRTLDLADEQGRDQKARDHEEDVDADEATWQRVGGEVADDDHGDGDCAQRLNLRAYPVAVPRRLLYPRRL